eukprot:8344038-Pyramimonas_sp.AAC.1
MRSSEGNVNGSIIGSSIKTDGYERLGSPDRVGHQEPAQQAAQGGGGCRRRLSRKTKQVTWSLDLEDKSGGPLKGPKFSNKSILSKRDCLSAFPGVNGASGTPEAVATLWDLSDNTCRSSNSADVPALASSIQSEQTDGALTSDIRGSMGTRSSSTEAPKLRAGEQGCCGRQKFSARVQGPCHTGSIAKHMQHG